MRIITNLRLLKRRFTRPVVAIGIFDGIHKGHKKVLQAVAKEARRINGTSVVLTFDPHPAGVLDLIGSPPLVVSLRHRLALLEKEGIDAACVLNFNESLARRTAQEFIEKILVKKIGAHLLVIGSDFRLGFQKRGGINLLKRLGKRFGFSVKRLPLFKSGGSPISSTRLRSLIASGDLKDAQKLLGRRVSILGTVARGSRRGRVLGYPTANVNPHHEVVPPRGVYAVYVIVENKKYNGVLNIGIKPTFRKAPNLSPIIEVHILGFNKKIYGKDIEIQFVKKLRDEKKFQNKTELINQIKIDGDKANMIL